MSSKDIKETRVMHYKTDNIEILIGNNAIGNINELFESFLFRYQIDFLEKSMRDGNFAFDYVD